MHKYTRFDAQSFKDEMICTMDSIGKYMLEIILHQQRTPHLLKQKKLMQTQEDHSNPVRALNVDSLKVDSVVIQNTCSETKDSNLETASSKSVEEQLGFYNKRQDLKGTRIEHGFKRAFMSLFGQDADIFTSTMLLKVDQLQQQLDKDEFQEDGSMTAFWVTQESKTDTGKAVNDDMVVIESSGTESEVKDDNSRSGNDTDADDADIRPIYDEEPMAKVQLTAECNLFAIGQQHTKQPKIINEGRVGQIKAHCIALELKYQNQALKSGQHGQVLNEESNKAKNKKEIDVLETINIELEHKVANFHKEKETLKKHYKDLYDYIRITRSKNIEQTTSLVANNATLKAQIQEKVFAIAALKNDLRKLKGNNIDTKFANTSILGKPVVQPLKKQSVVRQPNAFKNKRPQMSKQRFASQVDGNHNLSKPVTQHYLPKKSESAFAKPDHMIASSSSRNSSKNMPRFSSNDMVYHHYLDEAKKKTQERDRNSKTTVITPAIFQSTTDDSKPKPRSTNHSSRSLPISKSSCLTITAMSKADHSKSPRHTFSPIKTSAVYEKISPRSDLRWKPTGRIFKSVGLRWLLTGKLFNSSTSKVESEPPHGSNVDISKIHECKQTLDLSAGTSINVSKEQSLDVSACNLWNVNKENLRPRNTMSTKVSSTNTIVMTSRIELESLFDPSFAEYFDGENQVVSKPSAVTTADTSDKRQQQPDLTSSTLTLATTVSADGNFDL
nr:hypothetical protein [Tanacetum cinerariifolium]